MPQAISVERLLAELAAAPTPMAKLRLLARSWRQVRDLSPLQRQRVATAVGSRWAWQHLERLFQRDGRLSVEELLVKRAFDRLEGVDPAELRELARLIKEGNPGEVEEAAEPAMEEPPFEEPPVEEPPAKRPPPEAPPAEEPPPEGPPGKERPPVEEPPEEPPPVELPPSLEPPLASMPTSAAAPSSLGDRPARTASAVEALGMLRSLDGERDGPDLAHRAARASFVDRLGRPWARRRALSRLIRSRRLEDLDEALDLVARLDSPSHRTWCLGDLLESWELTAEELERILAAAPTGGARRRLQLRSGRAAAG